MSSDDVGELVRQWLGDAVSTLHDARTLLETGRSPRSVVNRSYYAMFYAVIALLQMIQRVPRKHQGAIALFDSEFVRTGKFDKALSDDLHRIFERRQIIDYQRPGPVSPDEATGALAAAERFVAAVRQYLIDTGSLA